MRLTRIAQSESSFRAAESLEVLFMVCCCSECPYCWTTTKRGRQERQRSTTTPFGVVITHYGFLLQIEQKTFSLLIFFILEMFAAGPWLWKLEKFPVGSNLLDYVWHSIYCLGSNLVRVHIGFFNLHFWRLYYFVTISKYGLCICAPDQGDPSSEALFSEQGADSTDGGGMDKSQQSSMRDLTSKTGDEIEVFIIYKEF